jgi:hypothetical protein
MYAHRSRMARSGPEQSGFKARIRSLFQSASMF